MTCKTYKKDTFISEIKEYTGLPDDKIERLYQKIQAIEFKATWNEFKSYFEQELSSYMANEMDYHLPEIKSSYEIIDIPDIDDVKDYDGIIKYLDAIKGVNIEYNLKALFFNSQSEENENYNYFACIYNVLAHKARGNAFGMFLCCYAQVLITQNISRLMLNWLIRNYANLCAGGLDQSLGVRLSNNRINYEEFINRSSFMRLMFALRLIDRNDPKGMEERAKKLLMSTFGSDDYNPRSFIDMAYYYAVMRLDKLDELNDMLRKLSNYILSYLFSDYIPEDKIRKYVNDMDISDIKMFLDFKRDSIKSCSSLIEGEDICRIAELKFDKMNVNYFKLNVDVRSTYTYEFYKENVEPRVESLNSDDFCRWMVGDRRFYERYYGNVSHTRQDEFLFISEADDVQQYAYKIVRKNVLSNNSGDDKLTLEGYPGVKKSDLLSVRNLSSYEEMISEIKRIIEPSLEFIRNYEGESSKVEKVRVYAEVDRDSLFAAIKDELLRWDVTDRDMKRSEFLLRKFKEAVENGDDGVEFMNKLEDDDEEDIMRSMRWESLNFKRYHDAMLYMCLNCENPMEMFERVNNTEGYNYNSY